MSTIASTLVLLACGSGFALYVIGWWKLRNYLLKKFPQDDPTY
jgi:hypothetical protein